MELNEFRAKVLAVLAAYASEHDIEFDEEFALAKLIEETGEVSNAILRLKNKVRKECRVNADLAKKELANELADLIGMAFLVAHIYDVDVSAAFEAKWFHRLP